MKVKRTAAAIIILSSILGGTAVQAKTTLQFWHNWGGAGGKVMAGLAENYNKSQNKVEVKVTQAGDTYQKLLVSVAAGSPPDVVVLDRYLTANYASRNVLLRLDSYVKQNNVSPSSFFKATWDEVLYKGGIYGIPMTTDSRTLWINKTMFKNAGLDYNRPPKSWNETRALSEKLTKRDSKGTIIEAGYIPTAEQGGVKIQYLWQNGGDIFNANETKVTFNSPEAIGAFKWLIDFMDYYGPTINKVSGNSMASMYKNKLAMVMNGPWMESELLKNAPKGFIDNTEFAPVPYFKQPAVLAGGMGLIIPANTKHKKEAWDFIRYITAAPQQIFFGSNNGTIPALKAAANSKEYKKDAFRSAHVNEMDVARPRPANAAFPDVEGLMNNAIDQALAHKKDIAQALASNLAPAQKILDTFNSRMAKRGK